MSLPQLEVREIQVKATARCISHSLDWGNNNSDINKGGWGCEKWKQSSSAVKHVNWYNILKYLQSWDKLKMYIFMTVLPMCAQKVSCEN